MKEYRITSVTGEVVATKKFRGDFCARKWFNGLCDRGIIKIPVQFEVRVMSDAAAASLPPLVHKGFDGRRTLIPQTPWRCV